MPYSTHLVHLDPADTITLLPLDVGGPVVAGDALAPSVALLTKDSWLGYDDEGLDIPKCQVIEYRYTGRRGAVVAHLYSDPCQDATDHAVAFWSWAPPDWTRNTWTRNTSDVAYVTVFAEWNTPVLRSQRPRGRTGRWMAPPYDGDFGRSIDEKLTQLWLEQGESAIYRALCDEYLDVTARAWEQAEFAGSALGLATMVTVLRGGLAAVLADDTWTPAP